MCSVEHAADELVPLVLRVVHVAVGDHVQARRQLDDLDLVAAVDDGGVAGVGADVVRPGVGSRGQFLGGMGGRLLGGAQFEQTRGTAARASAARPARSAFGRLVTAQNSPYWFTPSHVPPAWRSMPHTTRGVPDWIFGYCVGRSKRSSRLAATRMAYRAPRGTGWPSYT